MPTDLAMADADLFSALHHALAELTRCETSDDRRASARKSFRCVQLLAAYDGLQPPDQTDYAPVLFHDLSPCGFSYVADLPPVNKQLVAALGRTPFKFFVADVVNKRRIVQGHEPKWLIGCRFVRRME